MTRPSRFGAFLVAAVVVGVTFVGTPYLVRPFYDLMSAGGVVWSFSSDTFKTLAALRMAAVCQAIFCCYWAYQALHSADDNRGWSTAGIRVAVGMGGYVALAVVLALIARWTENVSPGQTVHAASLPGAAILWTLTSAMLIFLVIRERQSPAQIGSSGR